LITNERQLFSFDVEGPRKDYDFTMNLLEDIELDQEYQSVKFRMSPKSTYIGLDEETLVLNIQNDKMVTPDRPEITVANHETSITIYDSSDAIPDDVDSITTTLGWVVGFGSLASLFLSMALKVLLGGKFNLGWGLINFIQITAFIPLANLYFPGNVRGFASMLAVVNTAGKNAPNFFYTILDRDQLETEPYNYRFKVMGIDTTVFIDNCGPQMTIFCVLLVLVQAAKLLRRTVKKLKVKNKAVKWVTKKLYSIFSYNYLIRTLILLYLYFTMSAILTVRDVQFDNFHQAVSYAIGLTGFLLLIMLIFTIFSVIQLNTDKIISSRSYQKKIDCIISDINFEKRSLSRFYIPIYLLRRAFFVTCLVVFGKNIPVMVQYLMLLGH
jgi:hypothetical protein